MYSLSFEFLEEILRKNIHYFSHTDRVHREEFLRKIVRIDVLLNKGHNAFFVGVQKRLVPSWHTICGKHINIGV